nr:galactose-3-O-sulfotransferase 2 [Misgurnus anguillicaudatus]XP_055053272.1 galactose-3-O-sulfotransferase 2 [Misgurnus anguillicaudatus]XP_055053273.1 galactose-3-O-sulfotransferase 2 [Misgurnus anguillicaudatus]XP_055053275.1 galactose-3-O-sulfotransferase 2 [Misgurnus anguillicaudatus]
MHLPHSTTNFDRRFSWRNTLPWTCRKIKCFSRLRYILLILTILTVLCVTLQLMGVVQQDRSFDMLKLVSEQVDRLPEEIERPMTVKDWNKVRVILAEVVKDPADLRIFLKKYEEREYPHPLETSDQDLEHLTKNLNKSILTDPDSMDTLDNMDKPKEYPPPPPFIEEAFNQVDTAASMPWPTESPKCQPKQHIVFLKTHKTASSTILNILYRYGDSHNLTFALPLNKYNQLSYPIFFSPNFVEGFKSGSVKEFHILCNHMRFKSDQLRKFMPKDTFYFSILRDPITMMESLFSYYRSIPAFSPFKSIEDFLIHGEEKFKVSAPNNHYARNILTFDFGQDHTAPKNETELERRSAQIITAIEQDFSLIILSEYFDESMILLQHALCWTLDDIVSFRLNSRSDHSRRPMSPEMAERVKRWSSLDWRLYQHFNTTFWKRVDSTLGRKKLQQEVELLRERRRQLEQTCLLEGGAVDPKEIQDKALKPFQYGAAVIQGYNLRPGLNNETRQLCERLITPELQYTSLLYTKQFPQQAAALAAAAKKREEAKRKLLIQNQDVKPVDDKLSKTNIRAPTDTIVNIKDKHSSHQTANSTVHGDKRNAS